MSPSVLGIDLGTSAVKAVICRGDQVIGAGAAPLMQSSPRPGWSEQAPADWLVAVRKTVRKAVREAISSAPQTQIAGIAMSGQMHGAVVLDESAQVLRPAILWNDNRATAETARLAQAVPEIGRIAGVPPQPGFTAPKIMWLRAHEPQIYKRIRHVLLPKDYVGLWLSGACATDMSDAAGTLWLDQATRMWSPQILAASDTDPAWLPKLHYGHEPIGTLRAEAAQALGLEPGIAIFAGGGDAATGALSLGAASAGRCFISLGTSGQLMVIDDSYRPNPEQFVHAFAHCLPGLWYRMAAMLNGARPLAWFADVLGLSVAEMIAQAAQADPDRIPVFLPYLTGERSPHGDPDIRAAFYGMDGETGRAEMARAVIEAIAFMMADARDSLSPRFDPDGAIPVIGGGAQSDLVLQIMADALGHRVVRAQAGQGGAAFGAAILAQVGLGERSLRDCAFAPTLDVEMHPNATPALTERCARYRQLYRRLQGGL